MGSSQSQEDAPGADDTAQDYQQADASTAKPGSSRARASPPPHAPPASEPSSAIVPADASMHVQDPTLQQRLVGDTPGGLGSLRAVCASEGGLIGWWFCCWATIFVRSRQLFAVEIQEDF